MTTDRLQAITNQVREIQAALEEAAKEGPAGSPRRGAIAMATGWLVYVRRDLEQALKYVSETDREEDPDA